MPPPTSTLTGTNTPDYSFSLSFAPNGDVLTANDSVNGNGGGCNGEIYAGSRHVASGYGADTLLDHTDWLGTSRLRTDYQYTSSHGFLIAQSCTSLPFGDATSCHGGAGSSPLVFTGKELDNESGLDNFGARYFGSSLGRFMSPDDTDSDDHVGNPQGLNLYGYVQNNPTNATDPDGHDCVFVVGNTAALQRGDCSNAPSNATNVTYVPGTVDEKSGKYNSDTGTLTVNYTPYGSGANDPKGLAVIADVYPTHPGLTESQKFASAMTAGANNMDFLAEQEAYEFGGALGGRAISAGFEAFLASRAASPALKVVINWVHRLQDIRPGHLPPPGTREEIQAAVEAAVKAKNYITDANGVLQGTTNIRGIEVGFRGKIIGDTVRVSTVFTKR